MYWRWIGGMDLVKHVKENFKDTGVMVVTGYPSIEGAVEAVKKGAEEYIVKPFTAETLKEKLRHLEDKR